MSKDREKLPSQTVGGVRCNTAGRDVERVRFTVNVPQRSGTVYLYVTGEKVTRNYAMSLADWRRLSEAVPPCGSGEG